MKTRRPDFLCIGVPKGGSTWLYDNLRCHSDIWLPPLKSLKLFDGTAKAVRRKRVRSLIAGKSIGAWKLDQLGWYAKYFLSPGISERWYTSLFRPAEGQVCGEVAPSYCAMTKAQIKRVRHLLPKVRIVLILRNPVDRLWSHAFHSFLDAAGRSFEDITEEDVFEHFNRPGQREKTDYPRMLDNWLSVFPEEQIHVEFFEDIRNEPQALLRRVCTFLNIEVREECFAATLKAYSNKGAGHEMPPEIKQYLCGEYIDQMQEINRRLGGHAAHWVNDAANVLRRVA